MKKINTIRIATVYTRKCFRKILPCTVDIVRWLKISGTLADRGYQVDMIVNNGRRNKQITSNLRYVSFATVNWKDYGVIKTIFHEGFEFKKYEA